MSAARKPEPPDMGGVHDDWNRMTALRTQEQQPPPAPAPAGPQPEKKDTAPAMTRRSWYVEQDAADALAAAVDDVHFATRVPKHIVASRLMRAAAERAGDITDELKTHASHT